MSTLRRAPRIHHSTSLPVHFFGRTAELAQLDEALAGGMASLVAMVGPGGQGKTAIVQHWLQTRACGAGFQFCRAADSDSGGLGTIGILPHKSVDGLFFWSFYRGKSS